MFLFELPLYAMSFFLAQKVSTMSVEFEAEYYSNITLVCDDSLLALPYTTFKKYWILPSGEELQWSYEAGNNSRYIVGEFPDFNLTISRIDDDDFGWYYCVILWDNYIYLVHTIKVGLNVEGALYQELLDQYTKSAIIGLIAGGVTASLLGLCCLLYWCRYSNTNTQNDAKDKTDKKSKKNADKKNVLSETDRKADTVNSKEKEAIYELDKAVKDFDDDATVVGDGEVVTGMREDANIDTSSIVEDGTRVNLKVTKVSPSQEEIILHDLSAIDPVDIETSASIYEGVPPPPLPPPLLSGEDEDGEFQNGLTNNGFEHEEVTENATDDLIESNTELNYLYLDNAIQNDQYADVKF